MTARQVRGERATRALSEAARGDILHPEGVGSLREAGYVVRFAADEHDLEQVLRLRFRVFNEELGEGLSESWETGLDRDRFDDVCHHLMLIDERTDELVGTYRMQTAEMARAKSGFYTAQEYDLAEISESVLGASVELGRACILEEHRNGHALYALWRGLALYMTWSRNRYLFGCCSLTSQDPREGTAMLRYLERGGYMKDEFTAPTRAEYDCPLVSDADLAGWPDVKVPKLFSTYLRYGAFVCSPPALDHTFGTIDFLVCLDIEGLDARVKSLFFTNFGDALAERVD